MTRVVSKAETSAYLIALMVNFVDQMGPQFTSCVLVTYGQWIGASLTTISLFQTTRGLSAMMSNVWMPIMSDKFGRKWIAFLSVCGCATGYFIQSIAYLFKIPGIPDADQPDWGTPCIVFMIGRFVTGFFAGMQPVLQAYITELSAPEPALVTQRLVVMQVAANAGGIVIAPIAGATAYLGLQVPFMVVTIFGVIAVILVPFFFKEVEQIRALQATPPPAPEQDAPEQDAPEQAKDKVTREAPSSANEARDVHLLEPIDVENASFSQRELEKKRGSPFFDLVIVLMFCAYFCVMLMVNGGAMFLTPILFQQDSFGIEGKEISDAEFKQNVSATVAFASLPTGLCQVLVAILLFVPVTQRFGEVPTIVVMGFLGSSCFTLIGLFADKVWKVSIILGFLGVSFGFLTPALGPVAARYGRAIYPKQMALVQGIPLVGLQLSNALAQLILTPIIGDINASSDVLMPRLRHAYFFVTGAAVLFTCFFAGAANLSAKRVAEHEKSVGGGTSNEASTANDVDDVLAQITLKRSPASIGDTYTLVPFATPVLRRAISETKERKASQRAAAERARGAPGVGGGDGS